MHWLHCGICQHGGVHTKPFTHCSAALLQATIFFRLYLLLEKTKKYKKKILERKFVKKIDPNMLVNSHCPRRRCCRCPYAILLLLFFYKFLFLSYIVLSSNGSHRVRARERERVRVREKIMFIVKFLLLFPLNWIYMV